jgi:hypothetical protein
VHVDILTDRLDTSHGYTELTGEYLAVEVVVDYEGTRAVAEMAMTDGYPLMQLVAVDE